MGAAFATGHGAGVHPPSSEHSATAVEVGYADVLGVDQLAAGAQIFADQILMWH